MLVFGSNNDLQLKISNNDAFLTLESFKAMNESTAEMCNKLLWSYKRQWFSLNNIFSRQKYKNKKDLYKY